MQNLSFSLNYCRKIIVLEADDDVLMKRLEDGDNFNDALETIPKRIKTYRCIKDQTKESKVRRQKIITGSFGKFFSKKGGGGGGGSSQFPKLL